MRGFFGPTPSSVLQGGAAEGVSRSYPLTELAGWCHERASADGGVPWTAFCRGEASADGRVIVIEKGRSLLQELSTFHLRYFGLRGRCEGADVVFAASGKAKRRRNRSRGRCEGADVVFAASGKAKRRRNRLRGRREGADVVFAESLMAQVLPPQKRDRRHLFERDSRSG